MHSYAVGNLPHFMQRQYEFTAHLRDPENVAAPADVAPERMTVYRELIYNNVEDFLANAFPVLRAISSDAYWHSLVRDFFIHHRARTPLFPQMPGEFLLYLEQVRKPIHDDFAFLLELAHYEWAELALSISEERIEDSSIDPDGPLLQGVPRLSPLTWHFRYRFPVHRIGPNYIPTKAQATATHLVVYRDRNDKVGFLEINPVTSQLLERLQKQADLNGEQLLRQLAEDIHHPNPETVLSFGQKVLEELRQCDVILGTCSSSEPAIMPVLTTGSASASCLHIPAAKVQSC